MMRKFTPLLVAALVALVAAPAMAILVGEDLQPVIDDPSIAGGADGWSGIYTLNGYDPAPPEHISVTFNFWAQADRLDGNHVIQPLIIQAPDASDGTGSIWHIGAAIPDSEMVEGLNSKPFNSPPIPADGNLYFAAIYQWRSDGADNQSGAVIPFNGGGGQGMYATQRNENNWGDLVTGIDDSFIGENMDNGHASGPGGRRYWYNFDFIPDVTTKGDFNGDGVVNELDFDILAANLGAHLDRDVAHEDGDYNFNRTVDLDDFGGFKAAFPGVFAAATGIPEPATLGLAALMLTSVLLTGRRRRAKRSC